MSRRQVPSVTSGPASPCAIVHAKGNSTWRAPAKRASLFAGPALHLSVAVWFGVGGVMFKKILVPLDGFQAAEQALVVAGALALALLWNPLS